MIEFTSPLTPELTPDNWTEEINLQALSLDETMDLLADFKKIEAFGKKVGGFLKQAVTAKMPDEDEPVYEGTHYFAQINLRTRKGGLDEAKITTEMGEDWVEEHRKEPTEYKELRLKPVE